MDGLLDQKPNEIPKNQQDMTHTCWYRAEYETLILSIYIYENFRPEDYLSMIFLNEWNFNKHFFSIHVLVGQFA